MVSRRLIALVLALSAGSTSCLFRKPRARVFVPPPAKPRPPLPTQVPQVAAPPEINTATGISAPPQAADLGATTLEFPRLPAPPPAAPRRPPVVATPKPVPPPPPAPEPAPPQPRLGQIFSGEQVKEYNRNLDESLERVRRFLGSLSGRKLNAEQTEVVNRIRAFQNQAEQARDQDLVTAVSLARRADLLAQDLIGRLP
jgi:hypothetical protein